MSSSVVQLDVLLEILPDDVLIDFLSMCGMSFHDKACGKDGPVDHCSLSAAIEHAPFSVRQCVEKNLREIALLADDAGLEALRAVCARHPGRVNPLHLPSAAAQCALWMYLRHRDLFDEAVRTRGVHQTHAELIPLDSLRQPLPLPDAIVVDRVRLYEATLLDEVTGGEIAVKAPVCDPTVSVLDLLNTWMPTDNPMRQNRFRVVAAKLGVDLLPEHGQKAGRSVTLALKRRGGSNLADLDPDTRAQMEAWLAHWRLTSCRSSRAASSLSTTI
ncbi:MAG: hypothetical protein KF800_13990 [Lysobacter sp.]|nr:hypothetical protein [Lysobacter sp.]